MCLFLAIRMCVLAGRHLRIRPQYLAQISQNSTVFSFRCSSFNKHTLVLFPAVTDRNYYMI